ncbi:AAA ATPase [Pseudomonas sp. GM41(2012)]|uniref:AAA family ATPase n=1 Tax=Pseudomonas sp. (strain GM41(2012)) TaxID=1144708 RepID=UPI0002701149|nr:AAA family ATPase [Pseudomonas sp. GM41(2012)]EUB76870.1 AAA ATPase [Pseudomonas sp. GM41(2012)]
MRLDRLNIQNFRCYEDATFDFQPGFNLVVGVNGSGKTSLLQAIATCLTDFSNAFNGYFVPLDEELIRFAIDKHQGRVRFERCYPMQLKAEGCIFGLSNWVIEKLRNDGSASADANVLKVLTEKKNLLGTENNLDLPILAFYRANRRWAISGVTAESAASQRVSRLHGYENWFDAAANLTDFESWFIGKTLERLQKVSETEGAIKHFDDELSLVNSALKKALPNSHGLRYDITLRSLMVDLDTKESLPFNQLSDGQRAMIALMADIARRICLLNPHFGQKALAETVGIIIIDELDIHLHPSWQRSIVAALKSAFPKVQFIAASHSPQIIGSLKPEEVIVLNNGDGSHPRVTYGLDSSSVLEEVMDVSQREPKIEALLSKLFSTLEDNDLKKAKVQLEALKKQAPDLPEFAGAEALIRRKEILGK